MSFNINTKNAGLTATRAQNIMKAVIEIRGQIGSVSVMDKCFLHSERKSLINSPFGHYYKHYYGSAKEAVKDMRRAYRELTENDTASISPDAKTLSYDCARANVIKVYKDGEI